MKELLEGDPAYKGHVHEYDYHTLTDCSSAPNTTIELIAEDFARYVKAKLRSYPAGTQFDVIAHSMGGLVVRAYMVGMAPAPIGSYGNEIRRLIMAGTPNYGAPANLWDVIFRTWCKATGVSGAIGIQAEEMQYGARFLWDLDHKWLGKAPASPGNLLVIAGTASGVSDGIVRTTSAALPEDFFLPAGRILYVPYQHCDLIICGLSTPLINIQDNSHLTYIIVKEFLRSGQPPTQSSLGPQAQPSNQVLDDSLLLLRMVDKVTQTPIVPPPSVSLNCLLNINPTSIRNTDPGAGTVTVINIPASLWACGVQVNASRDYLGASINDITMFPGLPQVRAIELTQRPDRTR
jgi:hypothetical protein